MSIAAVKLGIYFMRIVDVQRSVELLRIAPSTSTGVRACLHRYYEFLCVKNPFGGFVLLSQLFV